MWTRLVDWAVIPPGPSIILILIGLLALRRRWGRFAAWIGLLALYAASIPLVSNLLVAVLQPPPLPTDANLKTAQAIVVLGGGAYRYTPDYPHGTVKDLTLARLRYAARLQRTSHLPILVSGGDPNRTGTSEAALMREALEQAFGAKVRWTESASRNTYENARFSWTILHGKGINRIVLVTSAVHMPRSLMVFRQAGFQVIPAPTDYLPTRAPPDWLVAWIPRGQTLGITARALHELIGELWYALRYKA